MKLSPLLNILLAAALVILACKITFSSSDSGKDAGVDSHDGISSATAKSGSTYRDIMTRTSIRQFADRKVSEAAVDSLLRAAMAAPTAANKQPWQFIVVSDKAMVDSLAELAPNWKPVGRAPLAVVACGDTTLTLPGDGEEYWVQDVSAATENLLLAAHSMGLGAVWCGAYPIKERVDALRGLLGLPANIIPLNVIAIGYPGEDPMPKEKYNADRIHLNRW